MEITVGHPRGWVVERTRKWVNLESSWEGEVGKVRRVDSKTQQKAWLSSLEEVENDTKLDLENEKNEGWWLVPGRNKSG